MNGFLNFLNNIIRSGLKGSFESEPVRKAVVINLFSIIGLFFLLLYSTRSFLIGQVGYALILLMASVIIALIFSYLRITMNYKTAGLLIVLVMFILEVYFLVLGGEDNTGHLWLYVFPLLSLFTLGLKRGALYTFLLIFVAILVFVFEPDFAIKYGSNVKIRIVTSYLAVSFMAFTLEYVRSTTYTTLVAANEKKSYYLVKVIEQQKEILVQTKKLELTNKELERLSLVAKKTDNAIAMMNPKGNIEWINEGFTRMYGYSIDELKIDKSRKLIGDESNLNIKDIINIWFGDKRTISYESQNITSKGEKVWAHTTLTPILDEDGKLFQLISIDSDISQQKKVEEELLQKNQDITDSITYAKRIQEAVMPALADFKKYFPESFVFNLPKDIVSGDFFWSAFKDGKVLVAAADCTGHGVPGAFMSLIGMNFLNKIVIEKGETIPGTILDMLRLRLKESLHQTEEEGGPTDGLDLALIAVDQKNKTIEYSGAMNPFYLIRDGELIIIKADKIPLGIYYELEHNYTNHKMEYYPGDIIYIFSDGFVDQFGGSKGSKFKYKRFIKTLKEIAHLPLQEQKQELALRFRLWRGDFEQVDDVLVLGIKLT
jgi:PAS domain S-box-containing protein